MLPLVKDVYGIITYIDGQSVSIPNDHVNFTKIKQAINSGDGQEVLRLLDIQKEINISLKEYTDEVELKHGTVYYKGEALHNELTRRIVELHSEGFDVQSYLNFLEKLMQNPSYNSREQLFTFIGNNRLPIHEDGDILAYKGVSDNYRDVHTGRFNNSVGQKHSMSRKLVDDNPSHDCSNGFHAGSEQYATSWGTKTVVVKINPKDCVSVPGHDTNKLRMCAYEVISEYKGTLNKPMYNSLENYNEYNEDYGEEEEYVDYPLESLMISDDIIFDYNGESRHIIITQMNEDYITGVLSSEDPSYDYGAYRTFIKSKISNLKILDV